MYEGRMRMEARGELRDYAHTGQPNEVKGCGTMMADLHEWCEEGIPPNAVKRIPKPGVVIYSVSPAGSGIVGWLVVENNALVLLAVGSAIEDEVSGVVEQKAISRL